MYDICVVLAEERFGGGAHAEAFLQLFAAAVSYPGNLGSEALNVVFLLVEKALGNEHGHTYILVTQRLEAAVKVFLHILPYSVAVGAYDHAALYARILNELGLLAYVCVPLCEILVH